MKNKLAVLTCILFYSLIFGSTNSDNEETENVVESFVNDKFQFIQEIYSQSWALVIGINKYKNVEPLTYAVNDAVAVSNMLQEIADHY